MRRSLIVISLLIIPILIFSAYLNTFKSPAVLDDYHTISDIRQHVDGQKKGIENAFSLSGTVFGWARWIPVLTLALDDWVGNGATFQFHLTNIVIHLLSTLAILLLSFQLVSIGKSRESLPEVPPIYYSLWITAIWALHPVQTNAVTYVVQRMASIQAFFFFSSVWLYVLARKQNAHPISFLYYLGCLITAAGAILSKENSAMLPPMLLITEIWFFQPELPSVILKRIRESKFFIQLSVAVAVLLFTFICFALCVHFSGNYDARNFNMHQRLLTEARVVILYLSLLVCPLPSRLSLEHDIVVSTSLINPISTLISIIVLVFLISLILRYRRRFPLLSYGGAWFFINLFIESSFINLELIFEHRLYLPSFGFFLFFVLAFVELARRLLVQLSEKDFLKLSWSAFAILFSVLSLLTFQRNEAWRDFISIHTDAVTKAPSNPRAYANLAVAYVRYEKYDEAIREAELAITLGEKGYEDYAVAANAIVGSLVGKGLYEEAIERGESLLDNKPKECDFGAFPNLYLNLAQAYLRIEKEKEAYLAASRGLEYASHMNRNYQELRLIQGMLSTILQAAENKKIDINGDGIADPGDLPINTWIAREFLAVGQRQQAKLLVEEVLAKTPNEQATKHFQSVIGNEERLDKMQQAKEDFRKKYVHHPYSIFNLCMAVAYIIRLEKLPSPFLAFGQSLLDHAIKLKPDNPDPYLLMGWYYHEQGDSDKAFKFAKSAVTLDPNNAKNWIGLGFFLISENQPTAAIDSFRKVLELYPGYPKKRVVLGIISDLEKGVGSLKATNDSLDQS